MNSREELFVSLSLSPWSLGLKQLLRGKGPLARMLPPGRRFIELYPAVGSHVKILFAWIYWLLDACAKDAVPDIEGDAVIIDCSLSRVRVSNAYGKILSAVKPENIGAAGEAEIMIKGEEFLQVRIAPGTDGGILIRHQEKYIPWIFPEGDGLHYYTSEKESGILPAYLIDEALKFADAVSKVILEYEKR